jgi:hypothetical protein
MPEPWQRDLTGPGWARWIWAGPFRRMLLSLLFLGICGYILGSAFSSPDDFFNDSWRAGGALLFTPLLVTAFGYMLIESIVDLVRGENPQPRLTRLPSFRDGLPWTALGIGAWATVVVVMWVALGR